MKRKRFTAPAHVSRQRHRYSNPHIKKESTFRKGILVLFLLFIVMTAVLYGVISLPWLFIKHVEISGTITTNANSIHQYTWQELNATRYHVIPEKHIWFVHTKSLETKLKEEFILTNVSVKKQKRTIYINVEERITPAVWATNNNFYFLGSNGTVIRTLTENEIGDVRAQLYAEGEHSNTLQSSIYLIFDQSQQVALVHDVIFNEHQLMTMQELFSFFENHWLDFEVFIVENRKSEWVTVQTKNGIDFYFDFFDNVDLQIANLEIALENSSKNLSEISYIDLRFGNKVFIK